MPVVLETLPSIPISKLKSHLRLIGERTILLNIGRSNSLQATLNIVYVDSISTMKLNYACNGALVSDLIEIAFLKTNLRRGSIAYFICPISKQRCRKLYLFKNHFVGRKGIQASRYYDQTISITKRNEISYIRRMCKNEIKINSIQQPYFMKYYNGCATKSYKEALNAAKILNGAW